MAITTTPTALASQLSGPVLYPGDPGFAEACAVWNLGYHHRPSVVVVPRDVHDVAVAVRLADEHDLTVTVQSSGHGIVGWANGGMLLLTRDLVDVQIDIDTCAATIGGGAKWDRVLDPAQDVGLAPLLGSTPDVGAVGYTLGGGMGWLGRKFGLSIDRVRSFEVVTADGRIRRVNDNDDAELFWALRGAGAGSLGVVTAMEIELVPVTRVYAGNLLYPAGLVHDVAAHYRSWIADAPDELTSSLVLMNYPPLDEVPDFLRGRSFVIVRGCFVGTDDAGADVLAHWRTWQPPEFDMWGPMPFRDVALISNDPIDPAYGLSTSEWLTQIDENVVEILAQRVFPTGGPPLLVFAEIRDAGGVIARSTNGSYGNRHERHLLQMVGITEGAAELPRLERYCENVRAELTPHASGGAYLNFLEGAEKAERARAGFDAASWARLRAVKAAVDPRNRFDRGLPLTGADPSGGPPV